MKRVRQFQQRLNLSPPQRWGGTAVLCLLSGAGWGFLAQLIQCQSVWYALAELNELWFWLTALFLGLLTLTASLLAHCVFIGNLAVGVPVILIALVNYFKTAITSTPLHIGDFSLIGRVGNIAAMNAASITFSPVTLLAVFAGVVWLAVAWLLAPPLRIQWKWSALGGLVAGVLFAALFWVDLDGQILAPLHAELGRQMTQTEVNDTCGVPLGLWRALYIQATNDLGAAYTPEQMETVLARTEEYAAGVADTTLPERPNVILVLSESFFDVTGLEGVTYGTDPAAGLRALKAEGVSGKFYTRSLGYGTSNIELEVFTGMNTGVLSGEDLYAWEPEVFTRLPSVPALLGERGYYTAMLHPYDDSIYHRAGYFTGMGFDDLYFSGDFAQFHPPAAQAEDYWGYMAEHISGGYYSDDLLTDLLISLYEARKGESAAPVFLYGLSMENHSPYRGDRYTEEELTVEVRSPLTGEGEKSILNLSQGVANADAALTKLVDYFRSVEEPTVIVFYGDHRPGLGITEGGSVYSHLGMVSSHKGDWTAEQYAELLSTDYLIWANRPEYLPGEPGSTVDTSCNYLGAELLDLTGTAKPLYWKLISRLSEHRVADTAFYHLGRDGVPSYDPPAGDAGAEGLRLLAMLLNDAVYGEQYVTGRLGGQPP